MVFSSLFFIFAFLPVTIVLYYALGKPLRNIVLLMASLFFYSWGEPVYVLLMCCSIMINYYIGAILGRGNTSRRKRKFFLIISLFFNLGCLAYYKYFSMIISLVSSIGSWNLNVVIPALPIGISFYTFQTLSYIIDVYKRKVKPQKNLIKFALYITMFPQLVAGPIVNYADVESQLVDRSMTYNKFYTGSRRFLRGLGKKVLLANNIGMLWSEVKIMPVEETSVLMAWVGIIAFTLQIYFDFSGYSDMAIGLGRMFGFHFKENFNYPYVSQSISEFWGRWHISLGSYFKEYVYIPLGGSRMGKLKLIRNMFIVWFLTGIWHGASWNFILWGIYFGVLILIEKILLKKSISKWPKFVRHIYLLLVVIIGWVFFEFTNLTDILRFLSIMFGMGENTFIDKQVVLELKTYSVLFIVCIILASSFPTKFALLFKNTHLDIYRLAVNFYYCILIFLVTGYMVASTYNPFIYFRF